MTIFNGPSLWGSLLGPSPLGQSVLGPLGGNNNNPYADTMASASSVQIILELTSMRQQVDGLTAIMRQMCDLMRSLGRLKEADDFSRMIDDVAGRR